MTKSGVFYFTFFYLNFYTFGDQQGYQGAECMGDSQGNKLIAIPREKSMVLPLHANIQIPRVLEAPTLLGRG